MRGRPKLGWMDDVQGGLGQPWMERRALVHMQINEFLLLPFLSSFFIFGCFCVFRTYASALVAYHLEMSWMSLHDAVEVNYEKDAATENQDICAKYMGKGVCMR